MKLKCTKVNDKFKSALFMWEEGPEGKRKKVVKTLIEGEEFDVDNLVGHGIITKYPENFEVLQYHEERKVEKVTTSPRNKMVLEEAAK